MIARVDTMIVGGGVIGLATAFELLRRDGAGRLLVAARGAPADGATWAAGGMLAPVSEAESSSADVVRLGLDSLARWRAFAADVERLAGSPVGLDLSGTLWVGIGRDDRAEVERQAEILARGGYVVERLTPAAATALEPRLSGRIGAAVLVPGEGQVDPRRLVAALERAVIGLGGAVERGVDVSAIEPLPDGRLAARTRSPAGGRIEARRVVVAAGAWSFRGLALPIADPGLRPVKGQLVRLRGPRLLDRVVRTPQTYLIPRADGELLVGATVEEAGYDERVTAGAVRELLRGAWDALPGIDELALVESSVGFRSALDDHRPRIGPTGIDGLHLAVGHYRNGVLLAPATAAYLAESILAERVDDAIAPFLPETRATAVPEARG